MINKDLISKEYSFTTFDDAGHEVICDTLALVDNGENPIIVYTDYSMDEDNKFNLFVSKIVENDGGFSLEKIDNYEDIPEIQNILNKLREE